MPWEKVDPLQQRFLFIAEYTKGYFSIAELARRFGISRKTAYKWINRFEDSGRNPDALIERPRIPHNSPGRTSKRATQALLELRQKHPYWGPKKLLHLAKQMHPRWKWPAKSTVNLILKKNGYIETKRKRIKRHHPGRPLTVAQRPNHIVTADFKGQFKTLDGVYCYPLTIVDEFSRCILAIHALLSTHQQPVKTVFRQVFQTYGLPEMIRTDNGNPFASSSLGRLSYLSSWWIRLGIIPELIQPGCPQQNARHERMHKTLKKETVIPPKADLRKQQRRFDEFREEFNNVRPHEALGMMTPAEIYTPSQKRMPKRVTDVEYPPHYEVRKVSDNAGIRLHGKRVLVGRVLAGKSIGLEEIDIGIWDVYYGPIWLGRLNEETGKIEDLDAKWYTTDRSKKQTLV